MKKILAFVMVLVCILILNACNNKGNEQQELISDKQQELSDTVKKDSDTVTANETKGAYTYEEMCELPADELLDLFIQNGLIISDELKQSFTEEELQSLFKDNFALWHTGESLMDYTAYIDLAEQTKTIYESIVDGSMKMNLEPNEDLPDENGQQYFNATVLEIKDGLVKVECTEPFNSGISVGEEVSVPMDVVAVSGAPELSIGDDIRVVFNGNTMETDPLQIETVFAIYLLDEDGEAIQNN